nr:single-stranded-DNA-specific exonuclease RecJ [Armatimonadota bacterium]
LGENRILVKFGMEEIARTGKLGLRALVDRSGLGAKGITSRNIGFVLGPRLNAAGRLDDASLSVRLLLTKDESEASRLADALEACNRERQAEQARMLQEAVSQIEKKRLDETSKVFVLSSAGWHPGVVGVVAGKITETYCRPTVMIALDDDGEMGVGSGRSIDGFNLFEALTECGALLEKFGGHAQAGGLSIVPGNLDEFDIAMNRHADQVLAECDLEPRVEADAEISLDAVTEDFIAELSLLEPYGHGNREPVFVTMGVPVLQKNTMGATGAHLKLRLGTPSGGTIDCVAFRWGAAAAAIRVGANIDVCYIASINDFNGSRNAQVMLRDARVSANRMGDALPSEYA